MDKTKDPLVEDMVILFIIAIVIFITVVIVDALRPHLPLTWTQILEWFGVTW